MDQVLTLSAIRERKVALSQSILDAQKQLADLEVAERIVRRFGREAPDEAAKAQTGDLLEQLKTAPAQTNGAMPAVQKTLVERALTARALILSILGRSENVWITANEIQEQATTIKGQIVPMATISPTLSNLKNEGFVVREGFKVALAERVENEAPNGGAAGASETAHTAQ